MESSLRRSLPPRAEFLGYLPRRELYERMARAHCLLVPSVREGWGMVVIEANSVGTPAVGYDVPGVRDSIRHGETGLIAPSGRAEVLAREASSLVEDPGRYEAICDCAHLWASRFSWDTTAERLLALALETDRSAGPQPFPESALAAR
jgi:glycosyltransferase involved in cell wall biosynthesis